MSPGYTERAVQLGDQLQSAASRLAEHVAASPAPYEVRMAAVEAVHAVEAWTELRRKWSGS